MPGLLLHANAIAQCTHVGPVTIAPGQMRVLVSTQPVATAAATITVAGCPFQVPTPGGPKPQPCVRVQWTMMSTRVFASGQPVLLQPTPSGPGPGVCQSAEQIPQGPPTINTMQTRVLGT
jgi:hypothetical protein